MNRLVTVKVNTDTRTRKEVEELKKQVEEALDAKVVILGDGEYVDVIGFTD